MFNKSLVHGKFAARAIEALEVYDSKYGIDGEEAEVMLLTDLMSLCNSGGYGGFELILAEAKRQYKRRG